MASSLLSNRAGSIASLDSLRPLVFHFRFVAPVAKLMIDELLERERSLLPRLDPASAYEAMCRGGVLIDIRSHEQRVSTGVVPGALRIVGGFVAWKAAGLPTAPFDDVAAR
jgi:hypothetical protein